MKLTLLQRSRNDTRIFPKQLQMLSFLAMYLASPKHPQAREYFVHVSLSYAARCVDVASIRVVRLFRLLITAFSGVLVLYGDNLGEEFELRGK